jgi:hypothetical protein
MLISIAVEQGRVCAYPPLADKADPALRTGFIRHSRQRPQIVGEKKTRTMAGMAGRGRKKTRTVSDAGLMVRVLLFAVLF